MNIHAIGQNLMLGKLGHLLVILSFATSLAACLAYLFATLTRNEVKKSLPWIAFGRKMYVLHAVSVFGVMASLLILIHTHSFEYKYIWEHTSKSLPFYYLKIYSSSHY